MMIPTEDTLEQEIAATSIPAVVNVTPEPIVAETSPISNGAESEVEQLTHETLEPVINELDKETGSPVSQAVNPDTDTFVPPAEDPVIERDTKANSFADPKDLRDDDESDPYNSQAKASFKDNRLNAGRDIYVDNSAYFNSIQDTVEKLIDKWDTPVHLHTHIPDVTAINAYCSLLQKNGILIVDSYDRVLLEAVASGICFSENAPGWEVNQLRMDQRVETKNSFSFHDILHPSLGKEKNKVIALFTGNNNLSVNLIRYLAENISDTNSDFVQRKKEWSKAKVHFLVLVNNREQIVLLEQPHPALQACRWHINPSKFLLLRYFKEETETDACLAEIEALSLKGLWNPPDTADGFDELVLHVQHGVFSLMREIAARKRVIENAALLLEKQRELEEAASPEMIFKEREYLLLPIVFTACYFEQLPVIAFKRLAEQVIRIPVTDKAADTFSTAASLQYAWESNPDNILSQAHLVGRYDADAGTDVIGFDVPGLRDRCRIYIEKRYPLFIHRCWQYLLLEQQQLMHETVSSPVYDRLVTLAATMAAKFPDEYAGSLFQQVAGDAANAAAMAIIEQGNTAAPVARLKKQEGFEKDGSSDKPDKSDTKPHQKNEDENTGDALFDTSDSAAITLYRCLTLVNAMVQHKSLEPKCIGFIATLSDAKRYYSLLFLLQRSMLSNICDMPAVMRTIVCQGDSRIRYHALDMLTSLFLKNSPTQLLDHLNAIWKWVNEAKANTIERRYALLVFPVYLAKAIESFPSDKYAKWPSGFHLFTGLDDAATHEPLASLITAWINHPDLLAAAKALFINTQEADMAIVKRMNYLFRSPLIYLWQAATIAKLFQVLAGNNQWPQHPMAATFMRLLENKCCKTIKQPDRYEIRKRWKNWRENNMRMIGRSKKTDGTLLSLLAEKQRLQNLLTHLY